MGEVLGMEWDELNLEASMWTIPQSRSKNKRSHTVPLTLTATEILKTMRRSGIWVFPAPRADDGPVRIGTLHKAVRRLRKATGLTFCTHDLRRTATTRMAECDVPQAVVAKAMNHSDQTVTARHYVWSSYDPQKRVALETWERHLNHILRRDAPTAAIIPFAVND